VLLLLVLVLVVLLVLVLLVLVLVLVLLVLVLVLLLLLPVLLVLLLLLLLLAGEACGLLTLPPASGRVDDEDVEGEQGDAWKDAVEGRNEYAALPKVTARRSDLRVCVLVPLVSGVRSLLL